MKELIAYRYKSRSADGLHETSWTPWRSGCLRSEMMTELRENGGASTVTRVQCVVKKAEPDPVTLRENDLWEWSRKRGWYKSNRRNWYADSFDPTIRPKPEDMLEPWDIPISRERMEYWEKKFRGIDDITHAITNDEMSNA